MVGREAGVYAQIPARTTTNVQLTTNHNISLLSPIPPQKSLFTEAPWQVEHRCAHTITSLLSLHTRAWVVDSTSEDKCTTLRLQKPLKNIATININSIKLGCLLNLGSCLNPLLNHHQPYVTASQAESYRRWVRQGNLPGYSPVCALSKVAWLLAHWLRNMEPWGILIAGA